MRTLKFEHDKSVCALEIKVKAARRELENDVAETIRKYLTTQKGWKEA